MVTQTDTKVIDAEFAFMGPVAFDPALFVANLMLAYFASGPSTQHHEECQQEQQCQQAGGRHEEWILQCAVEVWEKFSLKFCRLWAQRDKAAAGGGGGREQQEQQEQQAEQEEQEDQEEGGGGGDKAATAVGNGDAYPPALFTSSSSSSSSSSSVLSGVQEQVFQRLFRDMLGFAGAEMIRRLVGVAHVEDFEEIEDKARKAHSEVRALVFARWLVVASSSSSSSSSSRVSSMRSVVAKARLVAHCCDARRVLQPWNREPACLQMPSALLLVAKFPAPAVAKTRLASKVGSTSAADFALASLSDLLVNLADLGRGVDSILLFAPSSAQHSFEQLLHKLGVAHRWQLMAMVEGSTQSADLTHKLTAAHSAAIAKGYETVTFVGSDCCELSKQVVQTGITAAALEHKAFICPARDGGYVLLSLPWAPALPQEEEEGGGGGEAETGGVRGGCNRSVFADVAWSAPNTCLSQLARLQATGLQVVVGDTFEDVDEEEDLNRLRQRRAEVRKCKMSSVLPLPHVDEFLQQLPP